MSNINFYYNQPCIGCEPLTGSTVEINPNCGDVIVTADTNTVDLVGAGNSCSPLYANVKLSKQAGNNLLALTDGIYVSGSTGLLSQVYTTDSDSIDFSGLGTLASPLTAIVKGTTNNIYTSNGTLTGPRDVDMNGYSVTWKNNGLFRIASPTSGTTGSVYDFGASLDFIDWNATRSYNISQNLINGIRLKSLDLTNTKSSSLSLKDDVSIQHYVSEDVNTNMLIDSSGLMVTTKDALQDSSLYLNPGDSFISVSRNEGGSSNTNYQLNIGLNESLELKRAISGGSTRTLTLDATGVKVNTLSGVGTRTVVADANGYLSTIGSGPMELYVEDTQFDGNFTEADPLTIIATTKIANEDGTQQFTVGANQTLRFGNATFDSATKKIVFNGVTQLFGNENEINVDSVGPGSYSIAISPEYVGGFNIKYLGTVEVGTWNASPISDGFIESASAWNNKQDLIDGTGFVIAYGGGALGYDTNTYATLTDAEYYATQAQTNAEQNAAYYTDNAIAAIEDAGPSVAKGLINNFNQTLGGYKEFADGIQIGTTLNAPYLASPTARRILSVDSAGTFGTVENTTHYGTLAVTPTADNTVAFSVKSDSGTKSITLYSDNSGNNIINFTGSNGILRLGGSNFIGLNPGNTNVYTPLAVNGSSLPTEALDVTGNGKFSSLTGTGNRLVYATATGVLANSNDLKFDGTNLSIASILSPSTSLTLKQTTDTFGESGIIAINRAGSAGAIVYNSGLDLSDLVLKTNSSSQYNLRYEHRSSEFIDAANTGGEFQFMSVMGTIKNQSFGNASSWINKLKLGSAGAPSEVLDVDGNVKSSSLAGSGTRMVVASSTGVISTQAIPSGSTLTPASVSTINTGTNNTDYVTALGLNGSEYVDQYGTKNYCTATGVAGALVATFTPAFTAYTGGMTINVKVPFNVSTSATINVDGLGAKSIVQDAATVVQSTSMVSGATYTLTYNGTAFQLMSRYTDPAKANLSNPTFTGTVSAPTAAANTNSTVVATTAFVKSQAIISGWTVITGGAQTMTANAGYIANNASQITFNLPATAVVGAIYPIVGLGAGGWKIAQASGQSIKLSGTTTTTGTGGSITSGSQYDAIELICVIANTTFVARSVQGTLTIV